MTTVVSLDKGDHAFHLKVDRALWDVVCLCSISDRHFLGRIDNLDDKDDPIFFW